MKRDLLFELNKTQKSNWVILILAGLVQLVFLYFFTVVGRFEPSSKEDILSDYRGITGLSSAVTVCILVIYGTVLINRLIVSNYIGDSRLRLYLYPSGRGKLYLIKNIAFVISFSVYQLIGILIGNLIYLFGEYYFPVLVSPVPISTYWPEFISSAIICTLLTLSIVLLSSIVGIKMSSPVATVVSGIVLITLCGNLMAVSFFQSQNFTFVVVMLTFLLACAGIIMSVFRINKDEVL